MSPEFLMVGVGILPYDPYSSQSWWHSEITYLQTVSAKLTLPFKIAKITTEESFNSQTNTYFPLRYLKEGIV